MIKLLPILNEIQIRDDYWKKFHIGDKVQYFVKSRKEFRIGVLRNIYFVKRDWIGGGDIDEYNADGIQFYVYAPGTNHFGYWWMDPINPKEKKGNLFFKKTFKKVE